MSPRWEHHGPCAVEQIGPVGWWIVAASALAVALIALAVVWPS